MALYWHTIETGTTSADQNSLFGWCRDCLKAQRIKHGIMLVPPLQPHITESFEE